MGFHALLQFQNEFFLLPVVSFLKKARFLAELFVFRPHKGIRKVYS